MVMEFSTQGENFLSGFPIGNGKIAAMIRGNASEDRLTLNHEKLWTGQNKNNQIENVSAYLPTLRALVEKGDVFKATAFANLFWGGKGGISKIPAPIDDYVPAGELCFSWKDKVEFINRKLDLENGAVYTQRKSEKAGNIKSSFFADCVSGGFVFTAKSELPTEILIYFNRQQDSRLWYATKKYTDNVITFEAKYQRGTKFNVQIKIVSDGQANADYDGIYIKNLTSLTVYADISVNGGKFSTQNTDTQESFRLHSEKFSSLMNRTKLEIAECENISAEDLIAKCKKEGKGNVALYKLYFDYGKYLFLSSSICADLPVNLQGKWNDSLTPPWHSDYHLDINLQMNYWFADKVGFSEFFSPLEKFLIRLAENGKVLAQRLYGCRGIVFGHCADEWANPVPTAYGWAVWVSAAGWLGDHLYDHYLYTKDKSFLKRIYPYLKSVAEFYEDFFYSDANGTMQIVPSQSPENRYGEVGCFPVTIGKSSANDVQICYRSLTSAIEAAKILGVDEESCRVWQGLREKLPEFKIGKDGRLLEWDKEYEEIEPGHRHFAHLYGAYPAKLFSLEERSEQYAACLKALDFRIANGSGQTGWSAAWASVLYARAGRKKEFRDCFNKLVVGCTTSTLLDLVPPSIFQIDGNLGGVDALLEAAVSVHGKCVYLGQAIGSIINSGRLEGVVLPGGHQLSLQWEDGKICEATVFFKNDSSIRFYLNGHYVESSGRQGEKKYIN